jgi:hypothetical protein
MHSPVHSQRRQSNTQGVIPRNRASSGRSSSSSWPWRRSRQRPPRSSRQPQRRVQPRHGTIQPLRPSHQRSTRGSAASCHLSFRWVTGALVGPAAQSWSVLAIGVLVGGVAQNPHAGERRGAQAALLPSRHTHDFHKALSTKPGIAGSPSATARAQSATRLACWSPGPPRDRQLSGPGRPSYPSDRTWDQCDRWIVWLILPTPRHCSAAYACTSRSFMSCRPRTRLGASALSTFRGSARVVDVCASLPQPRLAGRSIATTRP